MTEPCPGASPRPESGGVPTAAEIVTSDAFRAINLLIDEKAKELLMWLDHCRVGVGRAFDAPYKTALGIRVSYEGSDRLREERDLPCDLHALKLAVSSVETADKLMGEIGDLQRFKLRLLNDYDFTHGDASEQLAVFRPDGGSRAVHGQTEGDRSGEHPNTTSQDKHNG